MVDALVLEASTSVCGFESHLPHQKKRAPKGAFFFCCQGIWHSQMPPAASGTSASLHVWQEPAVPPHTPPPFFVIPYSLRSKRTSPATGRGLEPNCAPGFFFAPNLRPRSSRSEPSRIKEGTREGAFFCFVPPASPRQPFPNPCRRAAHQSSSLFPLPSSRPGLPLPLPGSARELLSRGRRISSTAAMRDCKTPFPPRTAPHAGHRLILNPCRRAAHQNYSLFSIHLSRPGLPLPLPGSAREPLSAGGRRISSPAAMRDCKTPFPPAQPRLPGTGSF